MLLGLALDFALALGVAALWSLVDRRRHHQRLAGGLRVTLRYLVAVVLLVYGGCKVVNVQFPAPSEEDLLRPLGDQSPMGLLWAFMGVSPAYTVFAGLGEVLGAVLLFFRRTTTLGALILVGVLANVAVMNFAYDVPVKRGAALLLVAALALAARDARRMTHFLVLDRPTETSGERPFRAAPWLMRFRAVLKPTIVGLAVLAPMVAAGYVRSSQTAHAPLDGIYEVQRFVRDGVELPPLTTDTRRWRRLVLDSRGRASLQHMNDTFERRGLSIDAAARTLTLAASGAGGALTLEYELRADGGLLLRGRAPEEPEIELRALSPDKLFRLVRSPAQPR